MARFKAWRDLAENEVYICSSDSFGIPKSVFDVLGDRHGPFFGDWSKQQRTFRFDLQRGTEAVNWLREHGHRVAIAEGDPAATKALECGSCGCGYSSRYVATENEVCAECEKPLVLVPPHECTDECWMRGRHVHRAPREVRLNASVRETGTDPSEVLI